MQYCPAFQTYDPDYNAAGEDTVCDAGNQQCQVPVGGAQHHTLQEPECNLQQRCNLNGTRSCTTQPFGQALGHANTIKVNYNLGRGAAGEATCMYFERGCANPMLDCVTTLWTARTPVPLHHSPSLQLPPAPPHSPIFNPNSNLKQQCDVLLQDWGEDAEDAEMEEAMGPGMDDNKMDADVP